MRTAGWYETSDLCAGPGRGRARAGGGGPADVRSVHPAPRADRAGERPGEWAPAIAEQLGCGEQTVRNAIHAFNERGLGALFAGSSRPHTIHTAFDEAGVERLRALLHRSPRTFGKPTSVWTLELAAEVSCAEGLTAERVSDETIRQAIRRLGIGWKRAKRWITSPDPAYARKKGRAIA